MNKNFNLLRSQDGAPTRRKFSELGRSRSVLAEMSMAAPPICETSTRVLGCATVRVSSSQSLVHRSYVMHKSSSLNNAASPAIAPSTPPQPSSRSRADLCSIVEGQDFRQEDCVDNDINDSTLTRPGPEQSPLPATSATLTRINCHLHPCSDSDDNSPIWKRKDRAKQPPLPPKRNAPPVPLCLTPAPPSVASRQHLLSDRTSDTSSDTASVNSDRMSYQSSSFTGCTGNTSTSSLNSASTSSSSMTPTFAMSSNSSLTSNVETVGMHAHICNANHSLNHSLDHTPNHSRNHSNQSACNRTQNEFQKMPDRQRKRIYRIGLNIFNK